jgi:hypothetical protein
MRSGITVMSYPLVVFVVSFFVLWLSAWAGVYIHKNRPELESEDRDDYGVILAASLTLLGLIIGFSFSMAVSRYDLRKTYEEEEANAIGTEYLRAGLLPAEHAGKVRALLVTYLGKRIEFYNAPRDPEEIIRINKETAQLQDELWTAAQTFASAQPTPVNALAVAGMNDVINSQGYTQSAWWNRIPLAAWGLMIAIAVCCNVLTGYGARAPQKKSTRPLLLVLPLLVAISLFLIADIDSPRGGLIKVQPLNLQSLSESMQTP